eukprot:Nk52_evm18s226 gene=Nk52_evmTU18s226
MSSSSSSSLLNKHIIPVSEEYERFYNTQLPEELRIPRDTWTLHPHWPHQTLLLRGHNSFRAALEQITEEAIRLCNRDINPQPPGVKNPLVAMMYREFANVMGALHGHSGYEESKLFPYFYKKFNIDLRILLKDHKRLEISEEKTTSAFRECLTRGKWDQMDALRDALVDFNTLLVRHLREEENTVIPMLLSMSPEEYNTYYDTRAPNLGLRKYFIEKSSLKV